MIYAGSLLEVAVICPDCNKPMQRKMLYNAKSIPTEGDFLCVQCATEDCINQYFVSTVEKKTGMVLFTNATYRYPSKEERDVAEKENRLAPWVPMYPKYRDIKKER